MSDPATASPRPAIEMRGVTVNAMSDPDRTVVEEVNWSVAPGDSWVVGGLQGAGKSDLLAMTAGLMAPARGSYWFFGGEMPIFEEHRMSERLRLGLVFDGGQLLNHLTISENVSLPVRYHRNLSKAEAEAGVRPMLELTELAPWADSTPGAIGRNWRKRAGLARALMLKPEVLLLDNPLAGLDPRHRAWWLDFLGQLTRGHALMEGRPVTLVATADDLRPWRDRARHYAVLTDRRLVIRGSWQQLESAADDSVRELLALGPRSV